MCEHEGQPCPGRSCQCECMNCMFGEFDDEYDEDQAASDNADAGLDDHGNPVDEAKR